MAHNIGYEFQLGDSIARAFRRVAHERLLNFHNDRRLHLVG